MSEFTEAMKAYATALAAAGFREMRITPHPDLREKLRQEHRAGESTAQTIERLVLGEARARPACPALQRRNQERQDRRARNREVSRAKEE